MLVYFNLLVCVCVYLHVALFVSHVQTSCSIYLFITAKQILYVPCRVCGTTNVDPSDILHLYSSMFPTGPALSPQDVRNLIPERLAGGSQDAHNLLQLLLSKQAQEPDWYFQYQMDSQSCLTHLFWMSPTQRQTARDACQVLIHDNTYKTNRFNLPLGLFSGVNRYLPYYS